MALTWTLAEIRARWREHTGRSSTGDISDSDVNDLINDYYVNQFPNDAQVDEFNVFYTQALSATDTGIYSVAQNIDRLDEPVTLNGAEIVYYRDREVFFGGDGNNQLFHSTFNIGLGQYVDEQYITEPGLVIGVSDKAEVLHAAFDYNIQGFAHSKATSEVALTGSAIPQGKYGAWSLRIDADGDITVTAAGDNATGYSTPRKALEDLTESDNDSAYMGYVTVIKSDGVFTPATTDLDAANVTATFTDGQYENRGTPIAALLFGQDIYVRPKPNDIYELKAISVADRPTALSGDADLPDDEKWGPMIALGSAIQYLAPRSDTNRLSVIVPLFDFHKDGVRLDAYKRLKGKRPMATI